MFGRICCLGANVTMMALKIFLLFVVKEHFVSGEKTSKLPKRGITDDVEHCLAGREIGLKVVTGQDPN
jgi:hypothetical protein